MSMSAIVLPVLLLPLSVRTAKASSSVLALPTIARKPGHYDPVPSFPRPFAFPFSSYPVHQPPIDPCLHPLRAASVRTDP